jgi:hypothetical protein
MNKLKEFYRNATPDKNIPIIVLYTSMSWFIAGSVYSISPHISIIMYGLFGFLLLIHIGFSIAFSNHSVGNEKKQEDN